MLADMAVANTETAEVLFLIAAICAGVSALLQLARVNTYVPIAHALVAVTLCLLAVGFFAL